MKKKKIATLSLVAALAVTAIGGTMAYFTDTDYNKNVMVTGNVKIDQIEKDRNGDDFVDNKPLYPVSQKYTGQEEWQETEPNLVDKYVTVKNEGHTTAYVRTLFAFEAGPENANIPGGDLLTDPYIHFFHTQGNEIKFSTVKAANDGKDAYITIDGTRYVVGVAYYNNSTATDSEGIKTSAIAAGATTDASLQGVWLNSTAGNEFYDYVGDKYDILVLSQAVQTEGFTTAAKAFDAAFGTMTQANLQKWFETYTTSKGVSAENAVGAVGN